MKKNLLELYSPLNSGSGDDFGRYAVGWTPGL